MGATGFGVIAWHNGRRQTMTVRNGLPCDFIFALLMDNRRGLWLNARCGLISISNSDLQRWWSEPDTVLSVTVLDGADGAEPGHAPFNAAA
jgi:hypothetical protein